MQSLGKQILLYIPTFLNDQQSFKQSKTGQFRKNATSVTNLAISNLVSNSVKYVNKETNTFTAVPASPHKSRKTVAPTSNKQTLKISGVDSFMENLFTRDLSETASQLISSMRRPGSISNYNSSWAQWISWCNERKFDPFRCDTNQVVNHLSFLFDTRSPPKYVFKFYSVHKSWPCGKPIPSLEFHEYSEDKSLCVVTTIDEYIKRTVN